MHSIFAQRFPLETFETKGFLNQPFKGNNHVSFAWKAKAFLCSIKGLDRSGFEPEASTCFKALFPEVLIFFSLKAFLF